MSRVPLITNTAFTVRLQSKSWGVLAIALALPLACTGGSSERDGSAGSGTAGAAGDDRLFVPEGLANTNQSGADVGLVLVAFTLVQGKAGPELYAAVRNDDVTPICNAGLVTFFLDKADQVVSSDGAGLQGGRLYRLTDGPIVSSDPGEIGMTASPDFPDEIAIDQLGALQHQLPGFILDGIVPIAGPVVSDVKTVKTASGTAYTGTITNGLDVSASGLSVSVFPLNRVGRPLGVATSSAMIDVPPGGAWTFETTPSTTPASHTPRSRPLRFRSLEVRGPKTLNRTALRIGRLYPDVFRGSSTAPSERLGLSRRRGPRRSDVARPGVRTVTAGGSPSERAALSRRYPGEWRS